MAKRIRKPPVDPQHPAPDPAKWKKDDGFGMREAWLSKAIWGNVTMPGGEKWCLANYIHDRTKIWVPQSVRASVGWPYGSGNKGLNRIKADTIGTCHNSFGSARKYNEIFISPALGLSAPDKADPNASTLSVLSTLVHELVHAMDNGESKHGGFFIRTSLAVGLQSAARIGKNAYLPGVGTFTSTVLTKEMQDWCRDNIIERLGTFPHAKLSPPRPKDINRYAKLICPGCGMVARTTRGWLDSSGYPKCGKDGRTFKLDPRDGTNQRLDFGEE